MQTEHRLRELLAINRALTGALDYDHVLEQIVKKTAAFTEADSCVLVLADAQGRAMVASSVGVDAEKLGRFTAAFDERISVALRALLGYRPEDVFLGSPIIDRGTITGLLAVCRKDPQSVRPDDELMIGALADQAAIALINAARYRELRRELNTHVILTERIFTESPIGMLVLDTDLVVHDANPAAAQALDRSRQEIVGRSLSQLVGSENADHLGPLLRNAMAGETAGGTAFPYRDSNQRERFFETRFAQLPAHDDSVRGALLLFWDVTERMHAEAELRQADRRKDEFLAMLAHELRNPLAPIRNAVEILRRDGLPKEILARSREMIESQVRHLVRLVDDLLDVSRVTAGKIQLRKEPIELQSVIDSALDNAKQLIEARKHQLNVSVPPDTIRIQGDRTRLTQVLSNLLDNAAKYTEEGGTIWIGVEPQQDTVRIVVRDSGIGIMPELLPHVFELFTQAERSLDRAEGGLGIGLTLVHKLVELHGGSVEARSEGSGKGSEFIVTLPAPQAQPGENQQETRRSSDVEALSRRILVVDDNEATAESLSILLGMWGHEVATAPGGAEALALAPSFDPQIVLLDIGMPGMEGYEVARRLREELRLNPIIIAMTGFGRVEDRQRSREADLHAHLVKPVEPDMLKALLAEIG